MRRLIGSVLLMLSVPLLVSAQDARESWDNLNQLRTGQKIEVVDMNLKSVKGRFTSFSEEAISLRTGKREVTVQRPDVLRVTSREHSKRWRNILIGTAIGGGAGLAIGAVADRGIHETGEGNFAKAIFTPIGLGAGAGLAWCLL